MNASANPSAVVPSNDGVCGKGLVRRTAAKPQQCFADAVALVGIKEQTKPDKKKAGKAAVGIGPECEQGAPDTHDGSGQSVADNGQVVTGIGLPDRPAALLTQPKSDAAKADSALKPSPKDGGRKTTAGALQMVDGEQKTEGGGWQTANSAQKAEDGAQEELVSSASVGCASPTAFIGSIESWCAVHAQPTHTPPASKEGPSDRVAQATGSRRAAHPDTAEAQVSMPVPAGIDHQTPQKLQKDDGGDATAGTQTEPGNVEHKEQVVVAGESARKPQHARVGSDEASVNKGSNAPFTARHLPADHSSVATAKPDQTPPKDPSTSQDPATEAPQGSRKGSPGLGWEGQRQMVSRRADAPAGRSQPMRVIGSGDKNTVSGRHKDGASAQAEPPASSAGQPAVVMVRPSSLETRTGGVADVGTTQSPVRNVSEQILDSVRASVAQGDKQVSIRLQPPELGTVTVRLREQGEHLEGTLEAGKSDTRRQIEQALPEVVRSLQDAGVPIRRFDVTSSDLPGQDLGRGLPQQDAWSGQHGSGQNRDHAAASQAPWFRGADEYPVDSHETSSSDPQINPSHGRIDVLL